MTTRDHACPDAAIRFSFARAVHRSNLPARMRHLLAALDDFARGKAFAWPSRRTLAEWLGVSIATVQRWIAEAARRGLIEVQNRYLPRGGKTSNLYRIVREALPGFQSRKRADPVPRPEVRPPMAQNAPYESSKHHQDRQKSEPKEAPAREARLAALRRAVADVRPRWDGMAGQADRGVRPETPSGGRADAVAGRAAGMVCGSAEAPAAQPGRHRAAHAALRMAGVKGVMLERLAADERVDPAMVLGMVAEVRADGNVRSVGAVVVSRLAKNLGIPLAGSRGGFRADLMRALASIAGRAR